ncbi:reverse transcriptase domain-containing protein [Tanacetum coccineum]
MIKEHDHQSKIKATPRKLAYADSKKEALATSLANGFSNRFSLESSGTSDTYRQTRSTSKSQKTPFKNKELTHLRRLRMLEDQSTTKEKARRERSKSRGKRSRHQEISSNSEHEEGSKDAYEDLNSTYKRPKPTHFTQRITRIFSAAAKQEEWSMPVWSKIFRQTLGGAARNWFDDLDPKSVDSFEELSQKFLEEFSQQKRYAKDPTEIHGIKRGQNEAFMHGHGHPELAKKLNDKIPKTVDEMFERVMAFIRVEVVAGSAEMVRPSQGNKGYVRLAWSGVPEKARNRGGPREARRNMGVYTHSPRKYTFTPLIKTPKEILTMESVSFPEPPPLIKTSEKQNLNKLCDYHGDRGHNTNECYQLKKKIEEVVASGKLAHLVKDIRRNNQWNGNQGRNGMKVINMIREEGNRKRPFEEGRSGLMSELTFPEMPRSQLTDEPIILEGIIEGNQVRRILVDGGSSSEIMYEHCFRNLDVNIRSRLRRCKAPMIGFSGETYHPLGLISLRVTMGKEGRSKTVLMEFAIIKCYSSFNIIIGRTGMRSLGVIGSTIHSMIKFPTDQGVVTMETSRETLIREQAILRARSNSERGPSLGPVSLEKTRSKEDVEEVFTISHERPDQYVTMGATLRTNCKQLLADILRENMEIFAWVVSESTTVLRFVMEHQLKTYPLVKPVVHKRRPVAPERRLALKERVFRWLREGLIRKVRHPEWITNAIPIKLANGTWKLQMDYSSLNKACSKDMYPFPEEGEELASLMGYPYKCFL